MQFITATTPEPETDIFFILLCALFNITCSQEEKGEVGEGIWCKKEVFDNYSAFILYLWRKGRGEINYKKFLIEFSFIKDENIV